MKYSLLILATFFSIIIYANINYEHGIIDMTLLDGGLGCVCHDVQPDSTVNVWIEGPDTLFPNDTAYYKLMMNGGPSVKGGFDLAVRFGVLDSVDTLTYILFDELTHTVPKPFANATVLWDFIYKAPDSLVTDTIYSVANSVNGDGNPQPDDKWNFGENFPVTITAKPVSVDEAIILNGYILSQNYPNPFNPSTTINFTVAQNQRQETREVSLKVYDVLGNEVATLVDDEKLAGSYDVEFDANGLTSGIYFYTLVAGNVIETKKMVLLR
ncbi:MAG: T9SS type A sorting domain-containing protein [Ignavibacteriaceae bacterium]|nr:T9SS type A sorting domain-containing protein [Ignavibacteriaceae bacterium]